MPYVNRLDSLGIAREATRLSGESAPDTWLPYLDFNMQETQEHYANDSANGTRQGVISQNIAQKMAAGNLEAPMDIDLVGHILYHFFGSVSSNTASGATTHVFSVLEGPLIPTLSAFYERGGSWYRAVGVMVNELEIQASVGNDSAKLVANLVGLTEASTSSQTPAHTEPANVILPRHATFGYASSISGLSSATDYEIEDISIKMNNNNLQKFVMGSVSPVNNIAQTFEGEISMTAIMEASAFDTAFRNGTAQALRVSFINDQASNIGASSNKPQLILDIAPTIHNITYDKDRNGVTKFDLVSKFEYSVSDTFMIEPTLINEVTSYTS